MNFIRIKAIVSKELKVVKRQPALLFLVIIFPIIMTLTFNIAFGGETGGDTQQYDLAVVNLNENGVSDQWATYFIGNLSDSDILEVKKYTSNASAQTDLTQGLISGIIIIPADFGQGIESMQNNYGNPQNWINTTVYLYTDSASVFAKAAIPPIVQQALMITIFGPIPSVEIPIEIDSGQVGSESRENGFDMFAPGLFAFAIMFLTMIVAESIVGQREKGIIKRMSTTPVKSSEFITAQTIAYTVVALLQVILIFLTAFLTGYKPVLGGTAILMGLLIALIYAIITIGFGLITASISKTSGSATGLSFLFILPQMMLGTFVPVSEDIGRIMPSFYITDALKSIIVRGADPFSATIIEDLIILIIIAIVVFAIGVILNKKYGYK
jgi:ABC-type multidrug transport system permease subunit